MRIAVLWLGWMAGSTLAARADVLVKVEEPRVVQAMTDAGFKLVHAYRHFHWAVYRAAQADEAKLLATRVQSKITVQPIYKIRLSLIPNDPEAGGQGIIYPANDDADIHLKAAWDIRTSAGDAVVAVIDSGIELDHPDLIANLWTNPAELAGQAGVDDDNNGFIDDLHGWNFVDQNNDVNDTYGHGTEVSGLVGACGNNGIGIAGVCWDVKIMPIRIFAGPSTDDALALEAVDYALSFPAVRVINASWGGPDFDPALYDALAAANAQGVVVVVAPGNASQNLDVTPDYPSSFGLHNIVSVAALAQTGALASFSNYGAHVTLAAPGAGVLTTGVNMRYVTVSGTSFSTPIVSGALALAMAQNPGIAPAALRLRLIATSHHTDSLASIPLAGGVLDVHALLSTVNAARDWLNYR